MMGLAESLAFGHIASDLVTIAGAGDGWAALAVVTVFCVSLPFLMVGNIGPLATGSFAYFLPRNWK